MARTAVVPDDAMFAVNHPCSSGGIHADAEACELVRSCVDLRERILSGTQKLRRTRKHRARTDALRDILAEIQDLAEMMETAR